MILAAALSAWLFWRGTDRQQITSASKIPAIPERAAPSENTADAREAVAVKLANAGIDFFGLVMDENDKPLDGVRVEAMISYNRPETLFRGRKIERNLINAASDVDGRFSIEGQQGMSLKIESLEKEGYRFLRSSDSGLYTYALGGELHKPDLQNPVILRMIKDPGVVQIDTKEYILRFKWNDGVGRCDLSSEEFGSLGVLELNFLREGWERDSYNFQWKVDATLKGGGLIAIGEEPDFLAPKNGYSTAVVFGHGFEGVTSARGGVWLFARSAAGRYFLIKISVHPSAKTDARSIGTLYVRWNADGGPLLGKPE